jgi:hypothetical protein
MSDIQTFVNRLLAQEPATPNSIQLEIDTDGDVAALFEVLLTIMTSVLKAWYPPPISITQLTETDLRKLQAYFASFGIAFELVIEPVPCVLRINNREYERQTRLEDMRFQMTSADNLYTAKFAFLA